jgi:hypothetical protein
MSASKGSSRGQQSLWFAAPAVKKHLAVLQQLFPLEVGKLDMKLLVEKQIMKNASSMDPRGNLSAPASSWLSEGGRLSNSSGYVSVQATYQAECPCSRSS